MVPAGLVSVMPCALHQRHATGTPSFQDRRAAQGAPPTPAILEAREVGALELGMLHHELVGAGTPKKWVMPSAGSEMRSRAAPGSKARITRIVPPACSTGLA